jgi:hypothetical protein
VCQAPAGREAKADAKHQDHSRYSRFQRRQYAKESGKRASRRFLSDSFRNSADYSLLEERRQGRFSAFREQAVHLRTFLGHGPTANAALKMLQQTGLGCIVEFAYRLPEDLDFPFPTIHEWSPIPYTDHVRKILRALEKKLQLQ